MKPLLDLPWRSCKWPVAEQDGQHLFCGEPLGPDVDEKCFYCKAHEKRSINPSIRRWQDNQGSADALTKGERVPRREDEALRDLVEEIGEE